MLKFNTEIQNFTEVNLDEYTEDMENTAEKSFLAIQSHWIPASIEVCVSITIVDNQKIQSLNKQYRRKDQPTDVLSFPLFERADFENDVNGEEFFELGDIIISVERAIEQGEEFGHSLKRELCFLVAHSMLHLLGYDHKTTNDEEWMTMKQEEILSELKIQRGR